MELHEIAELRCFPSMPEVREPGYRFEVGADGQPRLQIDFKHESFALTAEELTTFIRILVERRRELGPSFPANPHADPTWLEADAYKLGEGALDSVGHVWSRVPGLGWVHLAFDAHPMRELAASILKLSDTEESSAAIKH